MIILDNKNASSLQVGQYFIDDNEYYKVLRVLKSNRSDLFRYEVKRGNTTLEVTYDYADKVMQISAKDYDDHYKPDYMIYRINKKDKIGYNNSSYYCKDHKWRFYSSKASNMILRFNIDDAEDKAVEFATKDQFNKYYVSK